jgi:hypothetical protein
VSEQIDYAKELVDILHNQSPAVIVAYLEQVASLHPHLHPALRRRVKRLVRRVEADDPIGLKEARCSLNRYD